MSTQAEPLPDEARALVERVRASEAFRKAPRMQELLVYLADASRRGTPPGCEEEIGVAVFGREPGYDTSVDTIVRTQVSHLRKKLELYFLSEGRAERQVITLPKGSYQLGVSPRDPLEAAAEKAAEARPPARPSVVRAAAAAVLVLLVLTVWLAYDNVRLRRETRAEAAPHVDRFWRQWLESGQPGRVVLSDAGVTLVSQTLGRRVTLAEYRKGTYPEALYDKLPLDEELRRMVTHAAVKGFSTPSDARVAQEIALACRRLGSTTAVVSARDFRTDVHDTGNVVLLGNPRSNPWMELFEADRAFEFRYAEAANKASIVSRAAGASEEKAYTVDWGRTSYCVVAYVPLPGGRGGSAILLLGADFLATEACGHLLTHESAMAGLQERLGVGPRDRLPHFEALLRVKQLGSATGGYEVVELHR